MKRRIMESADKIRRLREQTGITRKDFSMHIGIPLRTMEDWEAGRRRPPEAYAITMAFLLLIIKGCLVLKISKTDN